MLNWRSDPGYEQRMSKLRSETEQIRHENAKLRQLNARGRELLSSAALLCLAPEPSSIPPNSTLLDQLGPE